MATIRDDVSYQMGHLTADINDIKTRLNKIEKKIDNLSAWKWKTAGAVSVVAFCANFIFDLLKTRL